MAKQKQTLKMIPVYASEIDKKEIEKLAEKQHRTVSDYLKLKGLEKI